MNERFQKKLDLEKEKHEFGEIRHTVREPSTRSINTYVPAVAPRLLNVLNLVFALPERRHAILVENDSVAAVVAHALAPTRSIVYAHMTESKWEAPRNVTKMNAHDGVTEFNETGSEYDTIIMLRNAATTGYRIRDARVVLGATMDLLDREARQFAHRARANMGDDVEDVRTMIFINRADTEKFMAASSQMTSDFIGFDLE